MNVILKCSSISGILCDRLKKEVRFFFLTNLGTWVHLIGKGQRCARLDLMLL